MRNVRPRRSPARPFVAEPEGPRPHDLLLVSEIHPGAVEAVQLAVNHLFEQKVNRNHSVNAIEIVDSFIAEISGEENWLKWEDKDWLNWKTMLNLVRDIAVADSRYYGVRDPINEQYCAGCRKVKSRKEFTQHELRCDDCQDGRRKCHTTNTDARLRRVRSTDSP